MSGNESSLSSCSSDNESLPDLQKLKPYDLEPKMLSSDCSSTSSEEENSSSDSETFENSRIGNTDWCLCEKCLPMSTYTESICCLDTNEVPDAYFEGIHKIHNFISTQRHNVFNKKSLLSSHKCCHT